MYSHNCRRGLPSVHERVAPCRHFWLALILVLIPKFSDELKDSFGGANFCKAVFGIVYHALRLTDAHLHAFSFIIEAPSTTLVAVVSNATIDEVAVPSLFVAEVLNGFALILARRGVVFRVDTVKK